MVASSQVMNGKTAITAITSATMPRTAENRPTDDIPPTMLLGAQIEPACST